MHETKVRPNKKHVVLSAALALMLSLMMVPAMAFGASPADADYTLSVYNTGGTSAPDEDGQHAVVTIDFGAPVAITGGDNLQDVVITIAGNDITSPSYTRPATVTADGDTLIINIAGVVDSSDNPAFTADYSGILEIKGILTNVTVDGAAPEALYYKSVLPVGFTYTEDTEGEDTAQVTITSQAQVRGMFHIGIYTLDDTDLVPVYVGPTDISPIQVKTYVAHAHDFVNMTPADLAKTVVASVLADSNFDQSIYNIEIAGTSSIEVSYASGKSGPALYIYFFDDSLVHRVGATYPDLVEAGGILPTTP